MDPVCHTLVGAALGRAGLARRSSLGMTVLMIGANLPDIDVLAYLGGPAADLAFRRGWTHGVLALVVLPAILAGAVLTAHRALRRASRASLPSVTRPRELFLLSYIAVLTHPILDTLNTYGVRWLMPFSRQWYYGDTFFIADPWIWLVLGIGLYSSRRRRARHGFRMNPSKPPRVALIVVAAYAVTMAISGHIAGRMVAREITKDGGRAVDDVMVAPRPVTPFARAVVVARGDRYITGTFRWFSRPHLVPGSVREFSRSYPSDPNVREALKTPAARRFLGWARYPTFSVRAAEDGRRAVDIMDLRYATTAARFGALTVPVMGSTWPPSDSSTLTPGTRGNDR